MEHNFTRSLTERYNFLIQLKEYKSAIPITIPKKVVKKVISNKTQKS